MKINKSICVLLSLALLLSPITIKAEDNIQEFVTGQNNGSIAAYVDVAETYQITMPASINLIRNQETGVYEGAYTIGVKANLLNKETIIVKPNSYTVRFNYGPTFSCNSGIDGTIVQTVDTWTLTPTADNEILCDSSKYVEVQGTISASGFVEAQKYCATINFTFTKTDIPGQQGE